MDREEKSYYEGPLYKIASVSKGGGYMYARTEPMHPKASFRGVYALHRVLMENVLERSLTDDEVVHHKDGDKFNNHTSNLEVLSRSDHSSEHTRRKYDVHLVCPTCNGDFYVAPYDFRRRTRWNKSSTLCCSRSCSTKLQHQRRFDAMSI